MFFFPSPLAAMVAYCRRGARRRGAVSVDDQREDLKIATYVILASMQARCGCWEKWARSPLASVQLCCIGLNTSTEHSTDKARTREMRITTSNSRIKLACALSNSLQPTVTLNPLLASRCFLCLPGLRLEALPVHNGGTALVDGTTDPDRVLALWRGDDLDLHAGWGQSGDLLLHTVADTWVHGAYHDNVAVKVLTDVNITLHDRVEGGDVDTARFQTQHARLEQSLRSTETLVANGDDLAVRQFVGLLERRALAGGLDLLLEVKSDVAELLLDVTNDFALSGGGEGVTTLSQNLHEVVRQVTAGHVDTGNGVGQSETLVDRNNVSDTVTRVQHNTGGTTGSVQGQDGLDRDVEGWGVESLEDDLGHLLTVGLGVDGSFSQQDRVLLRVRIPRLLCASSPTYESF
ncbi:actin [Hortaea werneckii]|nr:actin [Hortaea werneckii]